MRIIPLISAEARHAAQEAIRQAQYGCTVLIMPKKASTGQRKKFHAICGDFARQHPFNGVMRTAKDWKVLLISAHAHVTGFDSEIVDGLEGEIVNLRESTAHMSSDRISSLIEYALAMGAEKGIKFRNRTTTHQKEHHHDF